MRRLVPGVSLFRKSLLLPVFMGAILGFVQETFAYKTSRFTLSNVQVSNIGQTGAQITWSTSLIATGQVEYGTSTSLGWSTPLQSSWTKNHTVLLSGLSPGVTYYYRVISKSQYQGTVTSSVSSFNTLNPSPVVTPTPSPTSSSSTTWNLTTTAADWDVIYDGYGYVTFDPVTGIVMQPEVPVTPTSTQAALALARRTEAQPLKDFIAQFVVATEQQLRTPVPNQWEVFWLFFNYNIDPSTGYKKTNYFLFKQEGVELGLAYDYIGETYLSTPTTPNLVIGQFYSITLTKVGTTVSVMIDGVPVMNYSGGPGMNVYDVPGSIGIYTEDARVHIKSFSITPL